jgi:hypothetical protein
MNKKCMPYNKYVHSSTKNTNLDFYLNINIRWQNGVSMEGWFTVIGPAFRGYGARPV